MDKTEPDQNIITPEMAKIINETVASQVKLHVD
jgi:hypothetical protein